jgi:hypothetical protein
MLQAVHGGAHSHPFGGAISAYALGQGIILHDFGYDGTGPVFHNVFLMRPATKSFLDFFGDPKGTLLAKIDNNFHARLTSLIPSPDRPGCTLRSVSFSAALNSGGKISYGVAVSNDEENCEWRGQ